MALRELYRTELAKAEAAKPHCDPCDIALVNLRAFAAGLPAELTAMGVTPFEVELFEEESELRLDTGPCMITARVTPAGRFRLSYEVKSPDDYAETDLPEVDTVDQLEAELARILAARA